MNSYSFVEGNEPTESDYTPVEFKNKVKNLKNLKKTKRSGKKKCFSPMFKIILIGILMVFLFDNFFPEQTNNKSNLLGLTTLPEFATLFKN
jgi:hypothetical protein